MAFNDKFTRGVCGAAATNLVVFAIDYQKVGSKPN
jgi:hypothetical protein